MAIVTALLCIWGFPEGLGNGAMPRVAIAQTSPLPQQAPSLQQQGQQLYQAGRYGEAAIAFQQAADAFQQQGDILEQAVALANVSLCQQQVGNWPEAIASLEESLRLVETASTPGERGPLARAQILDIQARLLLQQGQAEQALTLWETVAQLYTDLGEADRALQSRINRAQALRAMGLYRRTIQELQALSVEIADQPDSLTRALGLQSLGDALRVAGSLVESRRVLEESREMVERLRRSQPTPSLDETLITLTLSLANTAQAAEDWETAAPLYQQVAATTQNPTTRLQAQLNQIQGWITHNHWGEATDLQRQILPFVLALPPTRANLYIQIHFAQSWVNLREAIAAPAAPETPRSSLALLPATEVAQVLQTALQQAQALGDRRSESFALGILGRLYEETGQVAEAETVTRQALYLSQSMAAADISYRWQWQLGRVLKAQHQEAGAIAAYQEAVTTLQGLRGDLIAINTEAQFSFQKSIEPIYRQLVSLLLDSQASSHPGSDSLEQARQVIESLQQAELENFFQEACLDARPVAIDALDPKAAIFYPILLADRLEVILQLPGQSLQHYATTVSSQAVEEAVQQFRQDLTSRISPLRALNRAQQFYDWLLRPAAQQLQNSGVETLVFVLDGALRNIPMAALYDGQQFLLERYSIALTPGLQLLAPQPLQHLDLSVLAAGLTQGRQGFSPLPGVAAELEQIETVVPSRILLDSGFTREAVQQAIAQDHSPIVHLATHGQFSSNLDETFVLTWSDRIDINQLNGLLQQTVLDRQTPVELLVLSACQTAAGDRRATLGLAGIAVRAGARSTVASLWSVDDQATAELMIHFYEGLMHPGTTKAEALRQAQLSILNNPRYRRHPFYWAAFVLLGNWL